MCSWKLVSVIVHCDHCHLRCARVTIYCSSLPFTHTLYPALLTSTIKSDVALYTTTSSSILLGVFEKILSQSFAKFQKAFALRCFSDSQSNRIYILCLRNGSSRSKISSTKLCLYQPSGKTFADGPSLTALNVESIRNMNMRHREVIPSRYGIRIRHILRLWSLGYNLKLVEFSGLICSSGRLRLLTDRAFYRLPQDK